MEKWDKSARKDAIGFAFSGGGMQGVSHIGAIKALYEMGIRPDYVSGTSAGSVMAAFCAMGMSADEMRDFVAENLRMIAKLKKLKAAKRLLGYLFHTDKTDGLVDGAVISALEKCVKPGAEIFQVLLDRYQLKAGECLFVDDVKANVEGAEKVGIRGYWFDGDAEKLRNAVLPA